MAGAELTGEGQSGIIRETEVQSTLHGDTVILQIRYARCIAVEVFLLETGNLMEVRAAERGLTGITHSTRNRIVRQRLVLYHAHLLVIDNLVTVAFHAIERRLLILSLAGEAEAHQGALQRRAIAVLYVPLDNRTSEVDHEGVEQTVIQIAFPTHHAFELAGWRLQGNNLRTTDSLTDAGRSTTKDNLNLSDSVFRHIDAGTFTYITLHGNHAALTTG